MEANGLLKFKIIINILDSPFDSFEYIWCGSTAVVNSFTLESAGTLDVRCCLKSILALCTLTENNSSLLISNVIFRDNYFDFLLYKIIDYIVIFLHLCLVYYSAICLLVYLSRIRMGFCSGPAPLLDLMSARAGLMINNPSGMGQVRLERHNQAKINIFILAP